MKRIYWFIAIVSMLCVTACTTDMNDPNEGSSLYDSVKLTYGIEEVAASVSNAGQIPSVSLNEMQAILEVLHANSNKSNKCRLELGDNTNFGGKGEVNKKVIMGSEYTPVTRAGKTLDNFLLCVELKFNLQQEQVYYYGTDYLYNSQMFDWRANGLSISPAKSKDKYTYEFQSESFLFFKVRDNGDCIVKVGVSFKGEYNFKAESGTYRFQLEKQPK